MEFVDKLLQETNYLVLLNQLEKLEQERVFCRHGLSHLLDTARIAWIRQLERPGVLKKEQIYLAALLHDLGRIREYEDGTPHHEAGVAIAAQLLDEIGYPIEETAVVLQAIGGHRKEERSDSEKLEELLRWADKQSRNCFCCKAQAECKWAYEKRNQTIQY